MVMPAILGRALIASLTNANGGEVARRRLAILDVAADASFTTTTTAGDRRVIGITLEGVADGASGRLLVQGVTSCLVEGAVTRGHYLQASASAGALEDTGTLAQAELDAPAGACAVALEDGLGGEEVAVNFVGVKGGGGGGAAGPATQLDAEGEILEVDAIADGEYVRRVGDALVGATPSAPPATPATELDADGTVLAVNVVVDGEYLRRSGLTIISGVPAGGGGGGGYPAGEYTPLKAPASPSAWDDEFLAGVLAAAWTIQDSGAGTRINSVTQRPGWLYQSMLSGGGTTNTGVYKAFLPAGVPMTIVARCFGHVNDGANQIQLSVLDGAGALIYGVGKINGASQNFSVGDSGGSRNYGLTNIGGNIGETWLMLQYEGGTTIISAWVSGDGHVWHRLEGASRSGTIGRLKLTLYSAASVRTHAYWDFVRVLPGATFEVGNVG